MWYKYENFADPEFPIYSTAQQQTGLTVMAHFHPALELIKVCRGTPLVTVDSAPIRCGEGDLLFIPAYAVHSLESEGDCAIQSITFEPALLDATACKVDLQALLQRGRVKDLLCPHGAETAPLHTAFDALFAAYHTETPRRRLWILSALYGMTAALLDQFAAPQSSARNIGRLEPALRYMEAHFDQKISLKELAELLYISPEHCIRLFYEQTNKTPKQYLTDLRIREAMRLLAETDLSVEQIAARCGFAGGPHLCKVFKERIGKTPLVYRKRLGSK